MTSHRSNTLLHLQRLLVILFLGSCWCLFLIRQQLFLSRLLEAILRIFRLLILTGPSICRSLLICWLALMGLWLSLLGDRLEIIIVILWEKGDVAHLKGAWLLLWHTLIAHYLLILVCLLVRCSWESFATCRAKQFVRHIESALIMLVGLSGHLE